MGQVVVRDFDEVGNEIGCRLVPVFGEAVPKTGERAREEHDHQVPEVGSAAHRPSSVDFACITFGWCFQ